MKAPTAETADLSAADMLSEAEFAAMVDALAADTSGRDELVALLREDHPIYDQRGTAAVVRMRGWILLALGRVGLSDDGLLFVLEELDTGHDGYLVAAAARALRAYPSPSDAFASFVMRAIENIRYRDEPVAFDAYGAYAVSSSDTTPIRELLATLRWLGPSARGVLSNLEALREPGSGLSGKLLKDLERAVASLRRAVADVEPEAEDCCSWAGGLRGVSCWPFAGRRNSKAVQATIFEDQDGTTISYGDFFPGQPSIVAFFYTRCDNPQKCSLTVSKLAEVQRQLHERGVADRIRTAAITYDPGFDIPARLRAYGRNRQVRMDDAHRLLRATSGIEPLRRHFDLGVNFVGSLVNRHRIEIYVLDAAGRIAACFARVHWHEREVVDRAVALLDERDNNSNGALDASATTDRRTTGGMRLSAFEPHTPVPAGQHTDERAEVGRQGASHVTAPVFATLASLGVAFFPKCAMCWTTYATLFGIAGLEQIPYSPWMQPVLVAVILINLGSVWWRSRSTGRMAGFYLAVAGVLAIAASKMGVALTDAPMWGVAFTVAGSLMSVTSTRSSLFTSSFKRAPGVAPVGLAWSATRTLPASPRQRG